MDLLATILGFGKNLLTFFTNRQQVKHDIQQQTIGERNQVIADQNAALIAEQNINQVLADQPISKEDFDSQLSQGKF